MMHAGDAATASPGFPAPGWLLPLLLALMVPAFNLWVNALHAPGLLAPLLSDTDTLMRLVRVRAILEAGWGDGVTALGGMPYSEVLQWTAPLDGLLLGLRRLLAVAGVERALEWAAVLISPILQGLTCAAILALAPAAMPRPARLAAVLVIVLQPGLLAYTAAGRGDHHALLLFLFTLSALGVGRIVFDGSRRWPWLAGLAIGLGLWVSIEALVWWAAVLGILTMLWAGGDDRLLPAATRVALAVAAVAAAGWAVEAALGFYAADALDRLSVAWLAGFAATATALAGLARSAPPNWRAARRLAALTMAAGLAGTASLLLAPELLRGPFGGVDAEVFAIWAGHVREMRSVSDARSAGLYLALPAIAGLAAAVMAARSEASARVRWAAAALAIAGFAVVAALQVRWASYAGLAAAFIVAALAIPAARSSRPRDGALAAAGLAGAVALPWLLGMALAGPDRAQAAGTSNCDASTIVAAVADLAAAGEGPDRVLTAPDYGPAVAFYSPAEAALVPAHRMGAQIVALALALRSPDPAALQRAVRQHGIDAVALCDGGPGRVSFDGGPDSTYRRLLAGRPIGGLEPVVAGRAGLWVHRRVP